MIELLLFGDIEYPFCVNNVCPIFTTFTNKCEVPWACAYVSIGQTLHALLRSLHLKSLSRGQLSSCSANFIRLLCLLVVLECAIVL